MAPHTRNLFPRGNRKLGEAIHTWSLPAVETCPGSSGLCLSVCYARTGYFCYKSLQARLAENWLLAQQDDFAGKAIKEIRRRGIHILRIHVSGDFFAADYVKRWCEIVQHSCRTRFYAYTRSWRVDSILLELVNLASRPNLRLWYSCDAETSLPAEIPTGVRLAYLQLSEREQPVGELIFRPRKLRGTEVPVSLHAVLCPSEKTRQRSSEITCTSCRLCYR